MKTAVNVTDGKVNAIPYESKVEHNEYLKEVKKQNISIIGKGSESPLSVGSYKGTVQSGKDSKLLLLGKTNDNSWSLFLMNVKVKGGEFAGVIDRIPFNPENTYKANSVVNFEIKEVNGKRRGTIVE